MQHLHDLTLLLPRLFRLKFSLFKELTQTSIELKTLFLPCSKKKKEKEKVEVSGPFVSQVGLFEIIQSL